MFCVIQEIQLKKPNPYAASKELLIDTITWSINGVTKRKYGYKFSSEKFERPIKTAYKITIHQSYRENGKVKKKQYYVGTVGYYDISSHSLFDYVSDSRIKDIAEQLGQKTDDVWDMINTKYESIESKVIAEFQETEEYKTEQMHDDILQTYRDAKADFAEQYQCDQSEYDYCYNVFGELVNADYLRQIKQKYEAQKEYERRSYQYKKESNYNYSSYINSSASNYSDTEQVFLKKFYKTLASKFHPDITGDDGKAMQLLNKLKEQWNV